MLRTILLIAMTMAGCLASGERSTMQAVAAPSVTVVPRSASELAVSWTADPLAVRYSVLEGGAIAASVFDSSGGAPSTSWIATGLSPGQHCYAVEAAYADGATSNRSAPACAVAGAVPSVEGARTVWIPASAFVLTNGSAALDDGVWVPNGGVALTRWEAPALVAAGDTIVAVEAFYVRGQLAASENSYTVKVKERTVVAGSPLPASSDVAAASASASGASQYPNVDTLATGALAAVVPPDAEVWVKFDAFEGSQVAGLPRARFVGVRVSTAN